MHLQSLIARFSVISALKVLFEIRFGYSFAISNFAAIYFGPYSHLLQNQKGTKRHMAAAESRHTRINLGFAFPSLYTRSERPRSLVLFGDIG